MDVIFKGIKFYKVRNADLQDYYYISKCGQVLSTFWKEPKILALRKDKDGYLDVGLVKESGKRTQMRVHRLVALTFIDNPNNYPVINHINGVVDDNRVENLEWCTISHNTKHGYEKLGVIGNRQRITKVTNLRNGEFRIFNSLNEAGKYFNISPFGIARRISGRYNNPSKHGNLKDMYFEYLGYANVTTIETTPNWVEGSRVQSR